MPVWQLLALLLTPDRACSSLCEPAMEKLASALIAMAQQVPVPSSGLPD